LVKFGEPGNAGPPDEISGGLLFSLTGSGVSADRRICCLEKKSGFLPKAATLIFGRLPKFFSINRAAPEASNVAG
jgi:hypothetical protein